jgi:hypothetical protein
MLRVCMIFADKDVVWASPVASFRVPDVKGDHPMIKRNPGGSSVPSYLDLPPTTLTNGYIYGFTGFDTDLITRNHRVSINDFKVDGNRATANLNTCISSILTNITRVGLHHLLDLLVIIQIWIGP